MARQPPLSACHPSTSPMTDRPLPISLGNRPGPTPEWPAAALTMLPCQTTQAPSPTIPSDSNASPPMAGRRDDKGLMAPSLLLGHSERGHDLGDAHLFRVQEALERVAGQVEIGPFILVERLLPGRRLHR